MLQKLYGRIIMGDKSVVRQAADEMSALAVDQEMPAEGPELLPYETTLGREVSVTGPGTFFGHAQRTLHLLPSTRRGWWFSRTDLPDSLPIYVSVNNVWTTLRNIVLCSGAPSNYMRMVEHVIALKVGMGLDNLMIRMDSGDPPLFDRGSMDLVEAVERAGIVGLDKPARYVTVREPVTAGSENGGFLSFLPAENGSKDLFIDCGIHFKTAIGKQRIRFKVDRASFRHGAFARTNAPLSLMLYTKSIGKIFADMRNMGYTWNNILIAGPRRYVNKPHLLYNGKSLEAIWHRATLDLLAAVALIDAGRFAGTIVSYKVGHALDVQLIKELYNGDLLCPM